MSASLWIKKLSSCQTRNVAGECNRNRIGMCLDSRKERMSFLLPRISFLSANPKFDLDGAKGALLLTVADSSAPILALTVPSSHSVFIAYAFCIKPNTQLKVIGLKTSLRRELFHSTDWRRNFGRAASNARKIIFCIPTHSDEYSHACCLGCSNVHIFHQPRPFHALFQCVQRCRSSLLYLIG